MRKRRALPASTSAPRTAPRTSTGSATSGGTRPRGGAPGGEPAPPRRVALHPPLRAPPAQGWATYTGNGFYGGLQMDISFQRTYGPDLLRRKGTANNWSAVEQMRVAERAHGSGRGFYPWPSTALSRGLI